MASLIDVIFARWRYISLVIRLRSQVVYSKQPKLGLTQEFVVFLVRMRLVVCMFVCLFVCLFVCYNLFVCFTGNLGDWVLGRGGSLLLLEKLWDFLLQ